MSLIVFLISLLLLIIAMVFHEFAHGWTAYKLGDATAKYSGRLTFNPFAHIDIFWTVILPVLFFVLTGFFVAAAKPVPINYWALRNPKRDIALIGASGPLANLVLAVVVSILLRILPSNPLLVLILGKLIYINILLAVFNILPIPPLDGSRVVFGLLPETIAYQYMKIEPYGFLIVTILVFSGLLNNIIYPLVMSLSNLLGIPF